MMPAPAWWQARAGGCAGRPLLPASRLRLRDSVLPPPANRALSTSSLFAVCLIHGDGGHWRKEPRVHRVLHAQHLHSDRHVAGDCSRSDPGNGDRGGRIYGVGGGPGSDLGPECSPGCRLPFGLPSWGALGPPECVPLPSPTVPTASSVPVGPVPNGTRNTPCPQ